MSECCNDYGDCTQGRDCPARTGKVLPHQAAHAQRVARIKSTRPAWLPGDGVPPEAGNVRFEDDGVPLSYAETMELVRLMIYLLLGVIVFFGGLGLMMGYGTERWPEVIWAWLAELS